MTHFKPINKVIVCIACLTFLMPLSMAGSPVISNITVSQREGASMLVDITYDLYDAEGDVCSVWVVVSADGGQTWPIMVQTATGDEGPDIPPGAGKQITWDAGADVPGVAGDFKVRIYADDGNQMANMVPVPACPAFPTVGGFWIGKYEVTNQEYCEYLNQGQPDSNGHFHGGMEIVRVDNDGTYIYQVADGKQLYPVVWVSYNGATAYCNWRSQREGRIYHLPTGNEWYKAAAYNPNDNIYYVYGLQSDTLETHMANYLQSGIGGSTPVGTYQSYSCYYGCYDMCGNVWEWTTQPGPTATYYVIRGGCYADTITTESLKTSCVAAQGKFGSPHVGFRVVIGFVE